LRFAPVLPSAWEGFALDYRHRDTLYRITVHQCPAGVPPSVSVDGVEQTDGRIALADDGVEHAVEIRHPRAEPRGSLPMSP
jgi:cellobiose phosphorylase